MKTKTLNKTHRAIAAELLRQFIRRLHQDGNNDLVLDETKENRRLVYEAEAWNAGLTVAAWKAANPSAADALRPRNGKITTNNILIASYLQHLLVPEKPQQDT